MKKSAKSLSLLLSALLLFSLAACGAEEPEHTPQDEFDPVAVKHPTFSLAAPATDLMYFYETVAPQGFTFQKLEEKMDDIERTTISDPFHIGELVYQYSEFPYGAETPAVYYGRFDVYQSNDGTVAKILHGTDRICWYSRPRCECVTLITPPYTEEEAKEMADTFLQTLISPETWSEYRQIGGGRADDRSIVSYTRYIEGYKTDENISVYIDQHEQIVAFEWYNREKYDAPEYTFTKEDLQAAEQAMEQRIAELDLRTNVVPPEIKTGIDGRVYYTRHFIKEQQGCSAVVEILYVNVN